MSRREQNDERYEFVKAIRVHKYKNLRDCEFCKVFSQYYEHPMVLLFCDFF